MSKLFGGKPNQPKSGGSVPRSPTARGTYLAAGSDFEGRLFCKGPSCIAANFKGDLEGDDIIIVEQGAVVEATIRAANIIIHGTVTGDLIARDGVEVSPTGVLTGNVFAPKAKVAEGAQMRGQLNISSGEAAAAQPALLTQQPLTSRQQPAAQPQQGNVTPLDIKMSGDRVVVNAPAILSGKG